jgi:predicted PurR-regulated permease PerM
VLTLLVGVVAVILQPFLVPVGWAAILTVASWPTFRRFEQHLGGRTAWTAALMTVLTIVVVVGPTVLVSILLAVEVEEAYVQLRLWLETHRIAIPDWVSQIPMVGPQLAARAESLLADPSSVTRWAAGQVGPWARRTAGIVGDLGRVIANAAVTLLTLFFLYRHGASLAGQIERLARQHAGERVHAMIQRAAATVRAVMYGMVFTALAQGALSMLGYWVAGLGAPVLLGGMTAVLAFVPFGAPIVYVPVSLWLVVQGRLAAGLGLLAWGILVVSTSDNVVRSWFISGATRVPFLLVFFGVLGGVAAFGPIGLFLGPVAIALLLDLWREWTETKAA